MKSDIQDIETTDFKETKKKLIHHSGAIGSVLYPYTFHVTHSLFAPTKLLLANRKIRAQFSPLQ